MKCRKCHIDVPDESKYCPRCGTKLEISTKTKSRGNGTGSVYQKTPGDWCACVIYSYYLDENTKRLRKKTKSKSGFKTKKEALAYLQILKNPIQKQDIHVSFSTIYERWLKEHEKKVEHDTINCYKAAYKYYSDLYHVDFNMIKADHLQKCVDLCDKGRGTKKNMKTLALLMYKYAIKNDIAEKNYAEHIYVGKEQHNEKPFFSADEIKKIASAVGIVQNADTVLILIYTGFRINEFLNLKGSSYDPIEKTLTGGSKTEAGKDRVVTLSPKIESLVSALVTSDDAYLIRHNGGHCSDKIYRNDYYYPALKEIGVRPLPPHSCRHTFATLMKGVEAPATDKLKLIGHSKFEMTAYYTHTDLDSLRKITNNI